MVTARTINHTVMALKVVQVLLVITIMLTAGSIIKPESNADHSIDTEKSIAVDSTESTVARPELPPLDQFKVLWQRKLRQPLIDPVVESEPTPQPKPRRPLPRLQSTFVSGKRDLIQVAGANGNLRIVGLGDLIDGYTVVSISTGKALLQNGKSEYWIEIQRPEPLIAERP